MATISAQSTRDVRASTKYLKKDPVVISAKNGSVQRFAEEQKAIRKRFGKDGTRPVQARDAYGLVRDANGNPVYVRMGNGETQTESKYVQGYSLVQSFSKEELDPDDPNAWKKAQQLGHALAENRAEGYPVLVATEVNGRTGHVHNHILIGAMHPETGRSLDSDQLTHARMAIAHDKVLADHGLPQRDEMRAAVQQAAADMAEQRRRAIQNAPAGISPSALEKRITKAENSVKVKSYDARSVQQQREDRLTQEHQRYELNEQTREAMPAGSARPKERFSEIELQGRIRDSLKDQRSQDWDSLSKVGRENRVDIKPRGKDISYGMMLADEQGEVQEPAPAHRRRGSTLGADFRRSTVEKTLEDNREKARQQEAEKAREAEQEARLAEQAERDREAFQAAQQAELDRLEAEQAERDRAIAEMQQATDEKARALKEQYKPVQLETPAESGAETKQAEEPSLDTPQDQGAAPEVAEAQRAAPPEVAQPHEAISEKHTEPKTAQDRDQDAPAKENPFAKLKGAEPLQQEAPSAPEPQPQAGSQQPEKIQPGKTDYVPITQQAQSAQVGGQEQQAQQPAAQQAAPREERRAQFVREADRHDREILVVVGREKDDGTAVADLQLAHDDPAAQGQSGLHLRAEKKTVTDHAGRESQKTLVGSSLSKEKYQAIKQAAGNNRTTTPEGKEVLAVKGDVIHSVNRAGERTGNSTVKTDSVKPSDRQVQPDVLAKQRDSEDKAREQSRQAKAKAEREMSFRAPEKTPTRDTGRSR